MPNLPARFAEKRRILQLETLYDLALALHAHRPEQELVDELLQRVVPVLDPAAAVTVTRDPYGGARALGDRRLGRSAALRRGAPGRSAVARAAHRGAPAGAPRRPLRRPRLRRADRHAARLPRRLPRLHRADRQGGARRRRARRSATTTAASSTRWRRSPPSLSTRSATSSASRPSASGWRRRTRRCAAGWSARSPASASSPSRRRCARCSRWSSGSRRAASTSWCAARAAPARSWSPSSSTCCSGRDGPLVALNCAALPESLLESELFGIEGGVATGVAGARAASSSWPTAAPSSSTRSATCSRRCRPSCCAPSRSARSTRVGGAEPTPVDVRVVAATHRNLERAGRGGALPRGPLLPARRASRSSCRRCASGARTSPTWCATSSSAFCAREEIAVPVLRSEALALLMAHDFPGNVRELQNLVEGAVSLADGEVGADLVRSLIGTAAASGPRAARPRHRRAPAHLPRPRPHRRQQDRRRPHPRRRPQDAAAQRILRRAAASPAQSAAITPRTAAARASGTSSCRKWPASVRVTGAAGKASSWRFRARPRIGSRQAPHQGGGTAGGARPQVGPLEGGHRRMVVGVRHHAGEGERRGAARPAAQRPAVRAAPSAADRRAVALRPCAAHSAESRGGGRRGRRRPGGGRSGGRRCRGSRPRAGPTAVLARTRPATRSGTRAAAAQPIGPPQSWATSTTPRRSSAATSSATAPRGAAACARRAPGLSERPRPSRSGATQRRSPSRAITLRHRKLQVGLPWSSSTGRAPRGPWSRKHSRRPASGPSSRR